MILNLIRICDITDMVLNVWQMNKRITVVARRIVLNIILYNIKIILNYNTC